VFECSGPLAAPLFVLGAVAMPTEPVDINA